MKRTVSMIVLAMLLIVCFVPDAQAVSDDGFIDAIALDSGYSFSDDAQLQVRFVQNNTKSNDGIVQFVVTEELTDGSCITTFVSPFSEKEDGTLQQLTIQEYNAKVNVRGPVNEFNIIKGDVNVYLRAYYTSKMPSGTGGRYFRPVSAKMKCTFSSGTVTSAYVGLALYGQLYDCSSEPYEELALEYEYNEARTLGVMTSGVEKAATMPSMNNGEYVYVGSGGLPGCQFVMNWGFTRNSQSYSQSYNSMGHEEIYTHGSAG